MTPERLAVIRRREAALVQLSRIMSKREGEIMNAGIPPLSSIPEYVGSVFIDRFSAVPLRAIFKLHFPAVTQVIDLTYGRGRFWRWDWPFLLIGVDHDGGITHVVEPTVFYHLDSCSPEQVVAACYRSKHQPEVAVIDPPFLHGAPQSGQSTSSTGMHVDYHSVRRSEDVMQNYRGMLATAWELGCRGVVVKCKDTIASNKYVPIEAMVTLELSRAGFALVDKAVFVPATALPIDPKWRNIAHFRRQESYYLVGRRIPTTTPRRPHEHLSSRLP